MPKREPGVKLDPTANILQKQMLYFLPVMTFIIALKLPAGLPLYWAATTIFAILQQLIIRRRSQPPGVAVKEGA